MRVLPHLQDTGGFFVAALVKKSLLPWEKGAKKADNGGEETAEGGADDSKKRKSDEKTGGRQSKRPRFQGYREDPFVYLSWKEPDPAFSQIASFFEVRGLDQGQFLTRCKDPAKRNNLYFTSALVRDVVESNVDRIKIINAGVKAFTKCENKGTACPFRLAQEGSLMTIPFLGEGRVVRPTRADLVTLLLCDDAEQPPALTAMSPETLAQLERLETGSVALLHEDPEASLKLELVGWKGKASVRAYIPKKERVHYLRLVGGDTSKFEVNKFEARREKEAAEAAAAKEEGEISAKDSEGKREDRAKEEEEPAPKDDGDCPKSQEGTNTN